MLKKINNALLIVSILLSAVLWSKYVRDGGIFYGDALGYHAYLPAAFIHHNLDHIQDLELDTTIDVGIRNGMKNWPYSYSTNQDGNVIIQYTYGIAGMNAPFFFLGHALTQLSSESANGFSFWYIISIRLAGMCYGLMGLWLLYKVLVFYFDREVVRTSLLLLCFGTNLFWFMVIQAGMAHVQIFFLYSLIIFGSHKFYKTAKNKFAFLVAFSLGLLTVIRPTDLVAVLIPLLYGVSTKKDLINRINHLATNFNGAILPSIGIFILPILPQLFYWHHMTGEWIYYSYKEQSFNWLEPKLWEGMFGARNGWLTYSPMMIVPFLSIFILFRIKPMGWVNLILVPIYIYIIYSWWCFNYINGFGSRPMIHVYPLLVFSLVALLHTFRKVRNALLVLLTLLALVNINYTIKVLRGHLFTDESTHIFNFNTFFKIELSASDLILRDVPIRQVDSKSKVVIQSLTSSIHSPYDKVYNYDLDAFLINDTIEYSPFKLKHSLRKEEIEQHQSLIVSGNFMAPELVYDIYDHTMMVVTISRNGESLAWHGVKLNDKIGKADMRSGVEIRSYVVGEWGEVILSLPLKDFSEGDQVEVLIWNPTRKKLAVRDLKLMLGK